MKKYNDPDDPTAAIIGQHEDPDAHDKVTGLDTSGPPPLPAYRVFKVWYTRGSISDYETVTGHFWTIKDGAVLFGEFTYVPCTNPGCSEPWHMMEMYRRAIHGWVDVEEILNVGQGTGSTN